MDVLVNSLICAQVQVAQSHQVAHFLTSTLTLLNPEVTSDQVQLIFIAQLKYDQLAVTIFNNGAMVSQI